MSFSKKPDNRRQVYLALASSIEGQLRDAYAKRYEAGLDNQTTIADKLNIGRSEIHRRLSGKRNMTIETLADMVWALGQCVSVDIFDPFDRPSNEKRVISEHAISADGQFANSATSVIRPKLQFQNV